MSTFSVTVGPYLASFPCDKYTSWEVSIQHNDYRDHGTVPQALGKLPTPRAGQGGALYMLLSDFTVITLFNVYFLKLRTWLWTDCREGGQSGDNSKELDPSFLQVDLRSQIQIINQAWGVHPSLSAALLLKVIIVDRRNHASVHTVESIFRHFCGF